MPPRVSSQTFEINFLSEREMDWRIEKNALTVCFSKYVRKRTEKYLFRFLPFTPLEGGMFWRADWNHFRNAGEGVAGSVCWGLGDVVNALPGTTIPDIGVGTGAFGVGGLKSSHISIQK